MAGGGTSASGELHEAGGASTQTWNLEPLSSPSCLFLAGELCQGVAGGQGEQGVVGGAPHGLVEGLEEAGGALLRDLGQSIVHGGQQHQEEGALQHVGQDGR